MHAARQTATCFLCIEGLPTVKPVEEKIPGEPGKMFGIIEPKPEQRWMLICISMKMKRRQRALRIVNSSGAKT
jgi:hypothetical protein